MRRAVKYCGGCNSRYDRTAAARSLDDRLGEPLPPVQPGEDYDEVFVICGCSVQCADVSSISARALIWVTSDPA